MNGAGCDRRVMVVEDDRDVRDAIVEVLQDEGYHPLAAANGAEALERLREQPGHPCVILLDLMMPVMDGFQFRSLQRQSPELDGIPVVVLTAHANVGDAAQRLEAAAALRKPVDVGTLLDTVESFCVLD